jgi:hypothetical protein
MKGCGDSTGVQVYTHLFLTLVLQEDEWSTSGTSYYTTVKELWYPLNKRLGGPQCQSGHFEKEKNFFPLP